MSYVFSTPQFLVVYKEATTTMRSQQNSSLCWSSSFVVCITYREGHFCNAIEEHLEGGEEEEASIQMSVVDPIWRYVGS